MRWRTASLRGWTTTAAVAAAVVTAMSASPQEPRVAAPVGRLGPTQIAPPSAQVDEGPATAVITGRVVDAATGSPLAGATVRVTRATGPNLVLSDPVTAAAQRPPEESITNSGGYYVLRNLAKGNYQVMAQAAGYLDGSHGRRQPEGPARVLAVEIGQRVLNADVLLWRTAAVSGVLLDEVGEPAIATEVRALRRVYSGGRLRLVLLKSVQTDDRGVFRLGGLVPGDYVLSVSAMTVAVPTSVADAYRSVMQNPSIPPNDPQRLQMSQLMSESGGTLTPTVGGVRIGDLTIGRPGQSSAAPPDPQAGGPVFAYRQLYYPNATLSPQMSGLTLGSGEEKSGVELRLELTPTWRVSGTVSGPDGAVPNLALRLLPANIDEISTDSGFDIAATISDGAGRFTFVGVPPGSYSLRARRVPRATTASSVITTVISLGGSGGMMYSATPAAAPRSAPDAPGDPALWAQESVQVGQRDLADLSIVLRTGSRLSGQFRFEGSAQRPTADQMQRLTLTLRPLNQATAPSLAPQPARPDAEGRFASGQNLPGLYAVAVPAPPGWTIKTITVGGRDISGWPLEIGPTDVDDVVVTFSDRPASVTGTVRLGAGQAQTGTMVLLFPADVQRWISLGMPPALRRSLVAGDNGTFSASGLFAGDYLAVAVDAAQPIDLENPGAYASLARVATRVTITDGAQATVSLSPVPPR